MHDGARIRIHRNINPGGNWRAGTCRRSRSPGGRTKLLVVVVLLLLVVLLLIVVLLVLVVVLLLVRCCRRPSFSAIIPNSSAHRRRPRPIDLDLAVPVRRHGGRPEEPRPERRVARRRRRYVLPDGGVAASSPSSVVVSGTGIRALVRWAVVPLDAVRRFPLRRRWIIARQWHGHWQWHGHCCLLPRWLLCPDVFLSTPDMRVVVFHLLLLLLLLLLLRRRQMLLLRVAPPLRRRMSRMSMLILMRMLMLMRMELGKGSSRHGRHGGGTGLVGHGRRRRGGGDEVLVGGVPAVAAVTPMMMGSISLGLAWVAAADAARGGPVGRPVARRIPPASLGLLRLRWNLHLRLSPRMQMPGAAGVLRVPAHLGRRPVLVLVLGLGLVADAGNRGGVVVQQLRVHLGVGVHRHVGRRRRRRRPLGLPPRASRLLVLLVLLGHVVLRLLRLTRRLLLTLRSPRRRGRRLPARPLRRLRRLRGPRPGVHPVQVPAPLGARGVRSPQGLLQYESGATSAATCAVLPHRRCHAGMLDGLVAVGLAEVVGPVGRLGGQFGLGGVVLRSADLRLLLMSLRLLLLLLLDVLLGLAHLFWLLVRSMWLRLRLGLGRRYGDAKGRAAIVIVPLDDRPRVRLGADLPGRRPLVAAPHLPAHAGMCVRCGVGIVGAVVVRWGWRLGGGGGSGGTSSRGPGGGAPAVR